MSLQDKLLLVYTVACVLQTVVIAATGIFIFVQTRQAQRSLDHIQETARLNVYLEHRRHTQEINKLLLNDTDIRNLLGYDKPDMLAFLLIGHAETMFRQKTDSTVLPQVWQSQLQLIKKIFHMDFVDELWVKESVDFTPDFVEFVEKIRNSQTPPLRPAVSVYPLHPEMGRAAQIVILLFALFSRCGGLGGGGRRGPG